MSETAKTYINVVVLLAVAVVLGMLFGSSITYFLGTDPDTVASTVFNDRMSVVKQIFAEKNEDYQLISTDIVNNSLDDFRVVRNKTGKYKVITDGKVVDGLEYFDDETAEAVKRLFEDNSEALEAAKDYAGDPIGDVKLSMLVHSGGEIKWYHYHSNHGWIAVLYADKATIENSFDIIKLSTDENYDDGWGILYSFQ